MQKGPPAGGPFSFDLGKKDSGVWHVRKKQHGGQIPARPVQGCFLRKGAAGVAWNVERVRALGLVMQVRSYVYGKGAVEGSGTLRRLVGEHSGCCAAVVPVGEEV